MTQSDWKMHNAHTTILIFPMIILRIFFFFPQNLKERHWEIAARQFFYNPSQAIKSNNSAGICVARHRIGKAAPRFGHKRRSLCSCRSKNSAWKLFSSWRRVAKGVSRSWVAFEPFPECSRTKTWIHLRQLTRADIIFRIFLREQQFWNSRNRKNLFSLQAENSQSVNFSEKAYSQIALEPWPCSSVT